jgi:hypothetical protein
MRDERSSSQILFGFLPDQTVDLRGRIWKVEKWHTFSNESRIDIASLRAEVRRLAGPWRATGRDGGFVTDLDRGFALKVLQLDKSRGVEMAPFPKLYTCKACSRLVTDPTRQCRCGAMRYGQLPFVGYCKECGDLRAPFPRRCPQHNEVRIHLPGTASASEIRFSCPVCNAALGQGFGMPACQCGNGRVTFTVHRAAVVFTPRTFVLVNPPSPEKIQIITQAGGPARALAWVLDGMVDATVASTRPTRDSLRAQFVAQGFDSATIENMLAAAAGSSNLRSADEEYVLPANRAEAAQSEAVTIALAASHSRIRIGDMVRQTDPQSERGVLYRDGYTNALRHAGLEDVELLDRFPVLTGSYGYTRGPTDPGAGRLRAFRDARGTYLLYGDLVETEALFVRLSPLAIAHWLVSQGFQLPAFKDARSARLAILQTSELPDLTQNIDGTIGVAVLRLVHSYAHRLLRLTAVHAGIDRNGLAELLVPLHLGFYVYAAGRGDFVLGGLQAVFESELQRLMNDVVYGEYRCPMDPVCTRAGGACVACLHVGEPACRYFNRYLSRTTLFGENGYFALTTRDHR